MRMYYLPLLAAVSMASQLFGQSVAYVTHNVGGSGDNFGPAQRVLNVSPDAVVEIAGWVPPATSASPNIQIQFEDGTTTQIIRDLSGKPTPVMFTGVTQVTTNASGTSYTVTYRISTPSDALFSSVVTLPAQIGTTWNVSLERSIDLANWTAVAPGSFASDPGLQFFRVRLEKTAE